MFIPQATTNTPNALPRLDGAGKLAMLMLQSGGPNLVAVLDGTGKISGAQSQVATVAGRAGAVTLAVADVANAQDSTQKSQANGYAGLDGASKVVQEPASKGAANGIASLDGASKVVQEPASKGAANGIASLDGTGKVPASQLPDAIVGALKYMGVRDATTAEPSPKAKGDYYVISVQGTVALSGITDWKVGDWAVYDGAAWGKVDNTDAVTSIFGRAGTVTAQNGDYTVSQVTGAEAVANKGAANGYASLDGATRLPAAQLPVTAVVQDGSVGFTGSQAFQGTRKRINAKSAAYTVTATDDVIPVTAGAGGVPITLPPATGSGAEYKISKEDVAVGVVTVTADVTGTPDLINGQATFPITLQYEAYTFVDVAANAWRAF